MYCSLLYLWFSLKDSCRFAEIWLGLRKIESNLNLKRIPGHTNIKDHDTADYLAKNALSKDFCNNIVCHTLLDIFDWVFSTTKAKWNNSIPSQTTGVAYHKSSPNANHIQIPCSLWLKIHLFDVRPKLIRLIWVGVDVDFHAEEDLETCIGTQIWLIFTTCAYINRSFSARKSCKEVLHANPAWKSSMKMPACKSASKSANKSAMSILS